jgi:hypothetical protein
MVNGKSTIYEDCSFYFSEKNLSANFSIILDNYLKSVSSKIINDYIRLYCLDFLSFLEEAEVYSTKEITIDNIIAFVNYCPIKKFNIIQNHINNFCKYLKDQNLIEDDDILLFSVLLTYDKRITSISDQDRQHIHNISINDYFFSITQFISASNEYISKLKDSLTSFNDHVLSKCINLFIAFLILNKIPYSYSNALLFLAKIKDIMSYPTFRVYRKHLSGINYILTNEYFKSTVNIKITEKMPEWSIEEFNSYLDYLAPKLKASTAYNRKNKSQQFLIFLGSLGIQGWDAITLDVVEKYFSTLQHLKSRYINYKDTHSFIEYLANKGLVNIDPQLIKFDSYSTIANSYNSPDAENEFNRRMQINKNLPEWSIEVIKG